MTTLTPPDDLLDAIKHTSSYPIFFTPGHLLNASNILKVRTTPRMLQKHPKPERTKVFTMKDALVMHASKKKWVRADVEGDAGYVTGSTKVTWLNTPIGGGGVLTDILSFVQVNWPDAQWFMSLQGYQFIAVSQGEVVAFTTPCERCHVPEGRERRTSTTNSLHLLMRFESIAETACRDDFRRVFGRDLGMYRDRLFGFDIIKFEEDLYGKDREESCHSLVLADKGEEGVQIINALLGSGPFTKEQLAKATARYGLEHVVKTITAKRTADEDVDPPHDLEMLI